ncbi:MAG: coenzyme F420-0:L-glutamate ligase, partial [Oscillospiraceae bacterium]
MSRVFGTVSRGVRAPIIRKGDNLADIVVQSVMNATSEENVKLCDRDVIGVTEAVLARAQGNYASTDDIAADIKAKFADKTIGVIFPILSRNRFSICLRGIARGAKKVVLMLSYPGDEVGNELVSVDELDAKGVNPWSDVLTEAKYRELFGQNPHPFTGVDYVDYYLQLIREEGAEAEVIFANQATAILEYTKNVLYCDIHTRKRTKRLLQNAGAEILYGMDEIMTAPINGSGFNA